MWNRFCSTGCTSLCELQSKLLKEGYIGDSTIVGIKGDTRTLESESCPKW